MGSQTLSTFSRFNLTEEEILQGRILNLYQKQVIQNELADIADQLLALDYDPTNNLKWIQDNAFLKGQLGLFRQMLEASEAAETALLNSVQNTR